MYPETKQKVNRALKVMKTYAAKGGKIAGLIGLAGLTVLTVKEIIEVTNRWRACLLGKTINNKTEWCKIVNRSCANDQTGGIGGPYDCTERNLPVNAVQTLMFIARTKPPDDQLELLGKLSPSQSHDQVILPEKFQCI